MRFFRIPPDRRKLLLQAIFWLVADGVSLRLFPTRTLRASYRRQCRPINRGRVDAKSVARAVAIASDYVPYHTCLTRALVVSRLLQHHRLPSRMQIGVARIDGEFRAHAWVESDGGVVIGRTSDLERFVPLQKNGNVIAQCVA
ncbi:lasso peptide biosynthesis B2 protein [Novipirellula caenicola]|uniref:lasso peptide biosynthesis B2 protein n=1 Tax=Novipirellula caenicola TaxID=1536901 RepID=UPI003CD07E7D